MKDQNRSINPAYKDIFIRIVLSLLAAHFIVTFGDEESIEQIISNFNYYNALLASFIISFLLLYIIWLFTRYLDTKFDWQQHTTKRIIAQIGLGIVLPAGVSVLLAWIYFRMYGYNISDTPYFSSDFPVIVLLLCLANLYYFIYYMIFHFWPKGNMEREEGETQVSVEKPRPIEADKPMDITEAAFPDQQTAPVTTPADYTGKVWREIYIVNTPTRSIPIKARDICYFYRTSGVNFLRTFKGEDFAIQENLKVIEEQFSPELFFRINRQMIVNFEACSFFGNGDKEGTLIIELNPAFSADKNEKDRAMATVSEERVKNFKIWMDR
ncbi:MAG TPA: LytTR family DNA-binding domain-containing protein [Pseudosphingobacterium sp.]|nr:LytTR family DNA-binding domain-containing protein [Pseudosphingobacterium sp.]